MILNQRFVRLALIVSAVTVGTLATVHAQQTSVAFDSGAFTLYADSAKTIVLTGGTTADGNGAVLRLGYYTASSAANLFAGTFVPLTGQGSTNTAYNTTSIGDANARGAGNGTFALNLSFTPGSATTGNNLPAAGTILAIQFYNNTTLATSTMYNVASNTAWVWQTPAIPGPTVTITFDDANTQLLGGNSTAFYTSQPVPEPSALALGGLSLLGLIWVIRQRHIQLA